MRKGPFRQFPVKPEFCQHNQACGRLAWAPSYTTHMVPNSLNHFWGHRTQQEKACNSTEKIARKGPFCQFPVKPEFCQHNQACGRLAWAPSYITYMVPHSLNYFWGHRNTAGKPTPPKKAYFAWKGAFFRECSVPHYTITRVFPL